MTTQFRSGLLPLSCWKQEALLSGSRGCLRTPLLGLGLSYSLSGSIACSLSMAGSECGGRDCGNPNIKRDEKKSKAPQSRKPPHQAPIQRGSSGVMSRLPANRKGTRLVERRGVWAVGTLLGERCPLHGVQGLWKWVRGWSSELRNHLPRVRAPVSPITGDGACFPLISLSAPHL